jgi:hypothetical protein
VPSMKQPLKSTTETAGIFLCVFAPLRLCVYFSETAGISTRDPDLSNSGTVPKLLQGTVPEFLQGTVPEFLRVKRVPSMKQPLKSTTETAGIFLCVFAPFASLRLFLRNSRDLYARSGLTF